MTASTPHGAGADAGTGQDVRVRLSAAEVAARLDLPPPTAEQTAVVEAPLEPVLVVAGAGSGKTETMTARVVQLVVDGAVEPDRVLGLTFTRKAAGELAERVRRRLRALRRAGLLPSGTTGSPLVAPTIATYNSYAAGLVADHAMRLGIEPSSRLVGEAARWQLAHEVVEHWAADLGTDLAPTTVTAAVLDLAGAMAEHLCTPDQVRSELDRLLGALDATPGDGKVLAKHRNAVQDVRRSLELRSHLVDLVVELGERKRSADLIDFSDQVAVAARLAREVPEVGEVERARFQVVLLDEYQDTSIAQLELLRHLFGGAAGRPGHPVTAVGDPHQSIYGWRGASAGGLARFPRQFPAVGEQGRRPARVLALSTSWRNDEAVLDVANAIAGPLRDTQGGDLELPVLSPRPGAGAGSVTAAMLPTLEDEARAVAEFVAQRRAEGGSDGVPRTAAVLCRKRAQFSAVQAALRDAGLPVQVVGLGGLLTTPEVVDLVATLQVVHDPSRGDALMRLLTGPRLHLGLADVLALGDWAAHLARAPRRTGGEHEADVVDERSIVDALDDLPRSGWVSPQGRSLSTAGRERLQELARLLRALRTQTYLPVVDLVVTAERMLALDVEVMLVPGRAPATARASLDAFTQVAAGFAETAEVGTLGAFLAWLDAAEREERGLEAPVTEMDPGAVQVLTVHASKGLEWDVVAVPGLVERSFPDAGRGGGWVTDRGALPTSLRGDRDGLPDVDLTGAPDLPTLHERLEAFAGAHTAHGLQEERRLAYVAVTRARSDLLLTGSWWRDGARPVAPSTFLLEAAAVEGVVRQDWAPDPTQGEDGTAVRPSRPPRPEVEDPVWPDPLPLGADRHRRLDAAARAVRAAGMAEMAGEGRPHDPLTAHGGSGPESPDRSHDHELSDLAELLLRERDVRSRGDGGVRLPPHLSASAVVRLADDPAEFAAHLRRPVPAAPSAHARRGTEFHTWVERWFGRAALVDVDELPGADDDAGTEDAGLAELQQAFLASAWAERTPVAVEVDVETPVGGVVLRSRIDAVFADPDGRVVVVDWKTGSPPRDEAARKAREVQLAVYRLAWARRSGMPLDRVDAAFHHVADGLTVRPEELLDEDGLTALVLSGLEARQVPHG